MTPEAARDKKKMGVKLQTLRVITCSGIPKAQKEGVMNDPKSCQK